MNVLTRLGCEKESKSLKNITWSISAEIGINCLDLKWGLKRATLDQKYKKFQLVGALNNESNTFTQ